MILHEGLKNTYYLEKLIEKEDLQLNKHESQIWTKIIDLSKFVMGQLIQRSQN